MLSSAEVDGNKSEPDDACGVHGKADELGLIEGFRNLPGENGVDRADDYQQNGIRESDHVARVDGSLESSNIYCLKDLKKFVYYFNKVTV